MDERTEREDPFQSAHELLRRTESFLSSCASSADDALGTDEVQELIDALRELREGSGATRPAPLPSIEPRRRESA